MTSYATLTSPCRAKKTAKLAGMFGHDMPHVPSLICNWKATCQAVEQNNSPSIINPSCIETGRLTGFEALCAGTIGSGGGPADFVPAAEETGLIVPIGRGFWKKLVEVREWQVNSPGPET
jgi:predicted signal transduction protein with EAL and GGDEF domain